MFRPIRSIGPRRLITLPFEDLLVASTARVSGRSNESNGVEPARIVEILFGPDAVMAVLRPAGGPS